MCTGGYALHGIDFYFYFRSKNTFKEVLASFPRQELLTLCHQFCKVTVEEWHVPYIMTIEEKHEGWSQAG